MDRSLGKRIKMARVMRDMSQRQLAEAAAIHQSHLSMIENDKHDPSASIVRTLAQVLRVDSDYLLGLSPLMSRQAGERTPAMAAPVPA